MNLRLQERAVAALHAARQVIQAPAPRKTLHARCGDAERRLAELGALLCCGDVDEVVRTYYQDGEAKEMRADFLGGK